MRDILLSLTIIVLATLTFKRPYIGVLLIAWISYMNPHRLTWGFANNFPFAATAFIITVVALFMTKDRARPPNIAPIWFWGLFISWVCLSTQFALYPESTGELVRFLKIQLTILLTILLIRTPRHIMLLTTVITLSIGFYGIKGGLFTLTTLGNFRVWGPQGSFIGGNNEIALALLMIIPLCYALYLQQRHWALRVFFVGSIMLCLIATLGSHSRGALISLVCTMLFLWWQSPKKWMLAIITFALILGAIPFMPDEWFIRMGSIQEYEQDSSAMGRINSWLMAFKLASEHFFAGGFGVFSNAESFILYAPNPDVRVDAHSIYFEVLGEQGWGGLLLFLLLWLSSWHYASKIIKLSEKNIELSWAASLTRMIKVSLVAYASGGAFLGLAYWDLPYHLMAVIAVIYRYVTEQSQIASQQSAKSTDSSTHLSAIDNSHDRRNTQC